MEEQTYGTIRIHLDELIEERHISKSRLSHRAEMQRTQINHYCNNDIARLDISVLARLCTALDCTIGDLLEFVPAEKVNGKNAPDEKQE
ncbi:MAG: helix-turn-helix transcriptional regulator [Lachnospiraceae bacterium]|nr:helix-turn-helix transcriptional regulator [Lachnospiraceae bacterium]